MRHRFVHARRRPPARVALAVLASVVVLHAATACRGGDASPDRRTLVDSRDREDPRSLDPALSTDVPTGRAVSYLFDGLVRFTPDARIEPALAARWDVSDDGLTYTFHLRPGVTFHDGAALTARHVVESFTRALRPSTRAGRTWALTPIAGAETFAEGTAQSVRGLAAPDDSTVVIRLTEPLAAFPKLLAMPVAAIVPLAPATDFGTKPVGTGAWKLAEWRHDDYLLFARNETYWGEKPAAESLMARIIPEPSTAGAEFESGLVDVHVIPEGETQQWTDSDERSGRLQSAPALRLWYVSMNTTRGPLRDARVRQAINHAVDVPELLRELLGGRGILASGVVPPALGGDTTRARYAHDPARARQLLAEAGYPNGVDLELWSSQDPGFSRVAQALQAYLQEAGIRTRIVQRDAPSVREASRAGNVDLHVKDWWADYPDADAFLYPLLHSANHGPGGNVSFYRNPTLDSLVVRARRTSDDAERHRLEREADALAFRDAPMLYLFFYNELYAVQPWIDGFQVPTIFNGQRWVTAKIE